MTTLTRTKIIREPGRPEFVVTREFDAPRGLVFKAFTDPKLFAQWLGPRRLALIIKTFDPRTGGSYRFIHKDEFGKEFEFHGVFHEVLAPERIIKTFEFDGLPERGHVSLETVRFETLPDDGTLYQSQSVFQSVADRDGMFQADMEEGMNESYERLDELLAKIGEHLL